MQQYDKNLNEDQKIVLEMKLFESILNSDFNIRKTILQSEESWLNENLLNHFKDLVNNFMELEHNLHGALRRIFTLESGIEHRAFGFLLTISKC